MRLASILEHDNGVFDLADRTKRLTCFFTSAQVYFSDLSPTNFIGPRMVAALASPPLPIFLF